MNDLMTRDLMIRLELSALQDRYVSIIDNDRMEEWPTLFTEDCLYQIISKENEDLGLPAPIMHCDNARMLRDRVVAMRNANIFEQPIYRHCLSGLEWRSDGADGYLCQTSYVVINTSAAGESTVYQAGRYLDHVVRTADGLRFKAKRCIYDTSRVQTLLAYPI
ncbi:anthranilate 1,2-dioxygenase small subunit AndAd [Azospirillum endophyticum]